VRLLVVEDDDRIADFLIRALDAEGHLCTRIDNGDDAVSTVQSGNFDLVLLDLMLPGISGIDVCRELRFRNVAIPVIMLTAIDSIEDVVLGLKAGADDYVTKPFDIDELLARIETVSRRYQSEEQRNPLLKISDVTMNTESKIVKVNDIMISLTAKELSILELLMQNPEKLFSRERILANVWGANADPLTNVVDVYIGRLRKKLGKDKLPFIETVRGLGYRIAPALL
jgi:DNA-binding response OmpR family regulator